ncbi:carbohydrate-binding family 9-like protein [Paenibacillus pseudetheri]|nr:carbohydrate-binding family 9-like protein [Paenibacillus pseudetheri]
MERKLETLVISRLTNQTDVSDTDEVQIIKQYQWLKGYNPVVTARLNYSQEDLKLQFKVYEKNPIRTYRNMNDPVYKDSCIEFFFQPTPDSDQRYMNFEFNANGAILLQIGADRYDRFPITINPALFHILSTTDQINDKGEVYWELSFSISWVWVQSYFSDFRAVPGKRIRGNFYKCGDDTTYPHYGTWSEVHSNKPEFHSSCDFGILYLE